MKPHEIVGAYAQGERLLEELERTAKRDRSSGLAFVVEAGTRIGQVRYLLARFIELEHEFRFRDQEMREMGPHDPEGHVARAQFVHGYAPVLELHAEAFYLFAWRLREVVRQIPGLKKFQAKSVRDVRNWLIQHPEKNPKRGVLLRTFMYDVDVGFRLKPFGGTPETRVEDRGLYPNAVEFISELQPLLRAALPPADHTAPS